MFQTYMSPVALAAFRARVHASVVATERATRGGAIRELTNGATAGCAAIRATALADMLATVK